MHRAAPDSISSPPPSPPRYAFAALILANVCLAFGPWFVRQAEADGVGPVAAAFWRILLAVPLLLVILRVSGERVGRLDTRLIWLLVFAGAAFAADLASWHLGIVRTKLANATLFGNSTILILPIYGFLAARAWPDRNQGLALALAALGGGLLLGRSYEASAAYLAGDLLCLLAGALYTAYIVAMTRAREALAPWSALVLSTIGSVLPLLLFASLLGEPIWPRDWTPVLLLALVSQVLGQGLMTWALVYFPPIVIGLALLTQPIVSGTIGWVVYGETLAPLDFVGAALVAAALVLVRR